MLKILLIEAQSYLLTRKHPSDLEIVIPPIGLMYIASYLKGKLGDAIEVRVIKNIVDCISEQSLIDILKNYTPDIAGISGFIIFQKEFHQTAKVIKDFNRQITVVGGGPYVNMDLEEAIKDANIDYFVLGEGEITFSEFISKMLNKESPEDILGLAYRKGGKTVINPPRPFIEDLDSLPFPDYSLISVDKYSKFISYGFYRRKQAVVFSSRGCPYQCIFCHNMFGRKFRARSAENVFKEVEMLYRDYQIRDFQFVDDNFNLDYQRAMRIFELIIKSGMKINIYFPNGLRGDIIDHAFIDRMVEAGTILVLYSIETASERLQKFIKKFADLKKLRDNIHYTCSKGIMVGCYIMAGFPTESKEEALETVEFLKQFKKIVLPVFNSLRYYPNTEVYNIALKEGMPLNNIRDSYREPYHDISKCGTLLIPSLEFRNIHFKFVKEVFFSKERFLNAIEIQRKYSSEKEILDFYSVHLARRIKNIKKDLLAYTK